MRGGAVGLLIEATERRAAVAGDESRGPQPGQVVESAPIQQDADQRLHAGDENATILEQIFVVQGDFSMSHGKFFPAALPARVARIYKAARNACQSRARKRAKVGKSNG